MTPTAIKPDGPLETGSARITHKVSMQIQGPKSTYSRKSCSFVQRISPTNLLLLKAALLEGDAAITAYRAWRPTLDLTNISRGQRRLLPLLQSNLARLGIEDPLADRFRGIRRYFWIRNLKAIVVAQRVFRAFDQIGVPFIVLKGAALIACHLADRSLRPMEDIDILVREDRLADAIEVLTAMKLAPPGWITARYLTLSGSFRSNYPGCEFLGADQNIDLHWKALQLDQSPEADDRFWQALRETSLDGMPIRVLDPAHQLIHICAHAAPPDSAAAAELWPADAILLIRGSRDLCVDRLVSEAEQRGLSAIIAEALSFLTEEFNVSIPNAAISRMRARASWTERAEMRLLEIAPTTTKIDFWLRALLDFRRKSPGGPARPMLRVLPALLKRWAGVDQITPALAIAAQAIVGRPGWLRQFLGRDRYRIVPDIDRLPKVGDTLQLGGPAFEEIPLIAGWLNPEPAGRWAYGREATVAWCVRGQDEDLTLLIDGILTLHEEASGQRIELWANDHRIASWWLKTGSAMPPQVTVSRDLIRNREVLVLTFFVHHPLSAAGRSFYLRSLTLKAERTW